MSEPLGTFHIEFHYALPAPSADAVKAALESVNPLPGLSSFSIVNAWKDDKSPFVHVTVLFALPLPTVPQLTSALTTAGFDVAAIVEADHGYKE